MLARHIRPFLGSVVAGVLVAPMLVVALASGGQADEGDTLSTTGLGAQGQLGHGSTASRTSFGPVNTLVGVDEVAGGREHVVALIDGAVWSWGDGIKGATGLGNTAIRTSPDAGDRGGDGDDHRHGRSPPVTTTRSPACPTAPCAPGASTRWASWATGRRPSDCGP